MRISLEWLGGYARTAGLGLAVEGNGGAGLLSWPAGAAPELNPKELTVEAWVRAADGDCGPLVGNGRAASYFLALCEGVRFGHGGASTVLGASHPLWRRLAPRGHVAGALAVHLGPARPGRRP